MSIVEFMLSSLRPVVLVHSCESGLAKMILSAQTPLEHSRERMKLGNQECSII